MKSQKTQARLANLIRLICLVLFCGACSGGSKPNSSTPVPRRGENQVFYGYNSFDGYPSLSADGTRAVFVSTRDGIERIYKVNSDIGKEAPTSVLMPTGVIVGGQRLAESMAWLSPDANSVILRVDYGGYTPAAISKLYWVSFATGQNPQLIAQTTGKFSAVVFSSDSQFFAYTTTTLEGAHSVSLAQTGNPSPVKITDTAEQTAFFLQDQSSSPQYSLITFTMPQYPDQTRVAFSQLAFTDNTFNYSRSSWGTSPTQKIYSDSEPLMSRSLKRAYFVEDVSEQGDYVVAKGNAAALSGDVPYHVKTLVESIIASADVSGNQWQDETWTRYGSDIKSLSFSTLNELGTYVSQWEYKCKDSSGADLPTVSGGALLLAALSENGASSEQQLLLPVVNTISQEWTVASDPCTLSSLQLADTTVYAGVINANASKNNFRIIYSSAYKRSSSIFFLDQTSAGQTLRPVH